MLVACSNRIATAKYHHDYDFSLIKTYSIYERNSDFTEFQSMSDANRNRIEIAIEKALDHHGYQYKENDDAQVIIGYHLINRPSDLSKYNKGVKYCDFCLHAGEAAKNKNTWKVTMGSLVLDMVHRKNKRSIWRSVLPLRLKEDDNSFETQEKIKQAIDTMFQTLP